MSPHSRRDKAGSNEDKTPTSFGSIREGSPLLRSPEALAERLQEKTFATCAGQTQAGRQAGGQTDFAGGSRDANMSGVGVSKRNSTEEKRRGEKKSKRPLSVRKSFPRKRRNSIQMDSYFLAARRGVVVGVVGVTLSTTTLLSPPVTDEEATVCRCLLLLRKRQRQVNFQQR